MQTSAHPGSHPAVLEGFTQDSEPLTVSASLFYLLVISTFTQLMLPSPGLWSLDLLSSNELAPKPPRPLTPTAVTSAGNSSSTLTSVSRPQSGTTSLRWQLAPDLGHALPHRDR